MWQGRAPKTVEGPGSNEELDGLGRRRRWWWEGGTAVARLHAHLRMRGERGEKGLGEEGCVDAGADRINRPHTGGYQLPSFPLFVAGRVSHAEHTLWSCLHACQSCHAFHQAVLSLSMSSSELASHKLCYSKVGYSARSHVMHFTKLSLVSICPPSE